MNPESDDSDADVEGIEEAVQGTWNCRDGDGFNKWEMRKFLDSSGKF